MDQNTNSYIGKIFNRLTIKSIERRPNNKGHAVIWAICICSCGNDKSVTLSNLKQGQTKSCGCLKKETSGDRIFKMNVAKEVDGTFRDPKLGSAIRIYRDHHYNDGDLSFEEFLTLSQQECFYCGSPPSISYNTHKYNKYSSQKRIDEGNFIYNGLDRVNNTVKHNKSNLVTCCWDCNRAKLKRSKEEFLNWICKIYNHHYGIK
jgi:hypothetical protein